MLTLRLLKLVQQYIEPMSWMFKVRGDTTEDALSSIYIYIIYRSVTIIYTRVMYCVQNELCSCGSSLIQTKRDKILLWFHKYVQRLKNIFSNLLNKISSFANCPIIQWNLPDQTLIEGAALPSPPPQPPISYANGIHDQGGSLAGAA